MTANNSKCICQDILSFIFHFYFMLIFSMRLCLRSHRANWPEKYRLCNGSESKHSSRPININIFLFQFILCEQTKNRKCVSTSESFTSFFFWVVNYRSKKLDDTVWYGVFHDVYCFSFYNAEEEKKSAHKICLLARRVACKCRCNKHKTALNNANKFQSKWNRELKYVDRENRTIRVRNDRCI